MSTPINQITENVTDDEMLQDDNNHIVSEILQEMHTNNNNNNNNNNQKQYEEENVMQYNQEPSFVDNQQQMYQQSQQHQLQRQFDPLVNMPAHDSMHQQQQYNQVQDIHMDYPVIKEKSLKEKIIDKLKDPAIVLFCTFILNNLFTNMLLVKYLPQRFTNMASKVTLMAGDIVKSILVALLFFAFKTIL